MKYICYKNNNKKNYNFIYFYKEELNNFNFNNHVYKKIFIRELIQ